MKNLFLTDVDLDDEMLKPSPINFQCIINGSLLKPDLTLENPEALQTITQLLYGVS